MNERLLNEFLSADDFDASNLLENDEMFFWSDSDFETLVSDFNARLPDREIVYKDNAEPGEWAIPHFSCQGRCATFEATISSSDLQHALLCIHAVIGDDYQIYLAAETLGDSEVAICLLPSSLASSLQMQNANFENRLVKLSPIEPI